MADLDKRQREIARLVRKINKASATGKGIWLSAWDLDRLAELVNGAGERAAAHEAMLHVFVQRAYGQSSLAVH